MIKDQAESQEPAEIEEQKKPSFVHSPRQEFIDDANRCFLDGGEEGSDFLHLRRIWAFAPCCCSSSCLSHPQRHPFPVEGLGGFAQPDGHGEIGLLASW